MTDPNPLLVLLDRACRGVALTPDEGAALRVGIGQLRRTASELQAKAQQQAAQLAACHSDIHAMAERIVDLVEEQKRANRYRAAWHSARQRARLIPFGGNQVHDGTRWRPALQAYSTLRTRLAKAEQQLAESTSTREDPR